VLLYLILVYFFQNFYGAYFYRLFALNFFDRIKYNALNR